MITLRNNDILVILEELLKSKIKHRKVQNGKKKLFRPSYHIQANMFN